MSAVQARGVEAIMDMYQLHANNGTPHFAVFQNKDLIFKYDRGDPNEADNLLRSTLEALQDAQTQAEYTIKLYSSDTKKINKSTPEEGCFRCKVNDYVTGVGNPGYDPANYEARTLARQAGTSQQNVFMEILSTLKDLKEAQQPAIPVEPPKSQVQEIASVVSEVFEKVPVLEDIFRGIVKKWNIPIDDNYSSSSEPVTYAAGVTDTEINSAYATILHHDPEFPTVLVKLARLVTERPETYAMAKNMLNNAI